MKSKTILLLLLITICSFGQDGVKKKGVYNWTDYAFFTGPAVGIGTISASAKLDVKGSVSFQHTGIRNSSLFSFDTTGISLGFRSLVDTGLSQFFVGANGCSWTFRNALVGQLPNQDGLADQVLSTNGAGLWSFRTITVRGLDTMAVAISQFWNTSGNSGTNPVNNFVGTTDNVALRFRVNNVFAGKIENTGNQSTSFGYSALISDSGSNNTAFGYYAAGSIQGSQNTVMGSNALLHATSGNGNTVFGASSLGQTANTGSYNTALGWHVTFSTSDTIHGSTGIGAQSVIYRSNQLSISDSAVWLRMRLNGGSNGNVLTTDGLGNASWQASNMVLPATQLAYGTGSGIGGSSNLTYNSGTNDFLINGDSTAFEMKYAQGRIKSRVNKSFDINTSKDDSLLTINAPSSTNDGNFNLNNLKLNLFKKIDANHTWHIQSGDSILHSYNPYLFIGIGSPDSAYSGIIIGPDVVDLGIKNQITQESRHHKFSLLGDYNMDETYSVSDSIRGRASWQVNGWLIDQYPHGTKQSYLIQVGNNHAGDVLTMNATNDTAQWKAPVTPIAGSFSQVGASATTFTVSIVAQSGSAYKIGITPTSLNAETPYYVTNKTSTSFDVVYSTGITGPLTFDWALFK